MYATGSAATPLALLQAVQAFAITAGWTVDAAAAVYNPLGGTPNDIWLAIHQGAAYVNYWYRDSESSIELWGATGYSGAAGPNTQAGTSTFGTVVNLGAGPYTGYHLFGTLAGPVYLHCVVEATANIFYHMHAGRLKAAGGASLALYLAGTNWSIGSSSASFYDSGALGNALPFGNANYIGGTQILCTVDAVPTWFVAYQYGTTPARARLPLQQGAWLEHAINRTPNTFNELTVLFPMPIFVERNAGGIWSYIGDVADLRACNHANPSPKDEVTIGADTWKYFPGIAKTLPATWNLNGAPQSSGPYGFAFRKNA
jgi:hypothetical protein